MRRSGVRASQMSCPQIFRTGRGYTNAGASRVQRGSAETRLPELLNRRKVALEFVAQCRRHPAATNEEHNPTVALAQPPGTTSRNDSGHQCAAAGLVRATATAGHVASRRSAVPFAVPSNSDRPICAGDARRSGRSRKPVWAVSSIEGSTPSPLDHREMPRFAAILPIVSIREVDRWQPLKAARDRLNTGVFFPTVFPHASISASRARSCASAR